MDKFRPSHIWEKNRIDLSLKKQLNKKIVKKELYLGIDYSRMLIKSEGFH